MKLRTYWYRQVSQIKAEGFVAVQRKSRKVILVFFDVIFCALSVPPVLFVRLIKPLILIRIGHVRSDALGHSVFDPEYYLSEKEIQNNKAFDIFYFQTREHPNTYWSLMVRRTLRMNYFFRHLDKANKFLPKGDLHHKVAGVKGSRDLKGYLAKTKPHFSFTNQENKNGLKFIESLGLNSGDQFVCLIVRDSAYKKKYGDNRDWSYQDYRDSDIDTYEDVVKKLADKGYWIFRMGKLVEKPLQIDHPRIFDYAKSKYQSEFLDIWLLANSYFTISTGTGIDCVAGIFRKPIVYVNYDSIANIVTWSKSLTLTKKLFWEKEKCFLNLREQLGNSYQNKHKYNENGIKVIDLQSNEITDAILEFEARLTGKWKESDEDKELQARFWELFTSYPGFKKLHGVIHPESRFGAHFLRKNHDWFLA